MAARIVSIDQKEIYSYRFKTYGVRVVVNSNRSDMVEQAAAVAKRSLLGNLRELKNGAGDLVFDLIRTPGGTYRVVQNGVSLASGRSRRKFFNFFDSVLRAGVGEFNVDSVFIHAGVVGWRGKAILMPGDSYQGKSTLVAELVRQGASYYSDDFAIFDDNGLVHPFPRPLSMRTHDDGPLRTYELTPEDLGGSYGQQALPVGLVLFTGYSPSARFSPKMLTPGAGVLELMQYALPLRRNPDFSLKVLNKIASRAIIASSRRGSAEKFSTTLLKFVDKHVN